MERMLQDLLDELIIDESKLLYRLSANRSGMAILCISPIVSSPLKTGTMTCISSQPPAAGHLLSNHQESRTQVFFEKTPLQNEERGQKKIA